MSNAKSAIPLILFGLLLRYSTSLWPHSGESKPPLYGDYEAQRHWQEVTVNLPLSSWYSPSPDNDLLYWGLDYPPLTAYHSWLVGQAASQVNTSYTALHTSRGTEDERHKLFMRLSVLVGDLLVYLPSCLWFTGATAVSPAMVSLALYPGIIVVDHGHFQYNSISLGLLVAAVAAVFSSRNYTASVLFVLALNYKQMELYHALPFFFYLLARCCRQQGVVRKLVMLALIGATVITTFGIVWFPFLKSGPATVMQVLVRLFPFNRGVFEDKVSNFWCALDIFVKLKSRFSHDVLAKLCLSTTFCLSLPNNLHLFRNPSQSTFLLSLCNTSLIFFLFSFQVHEKSILLAAIPIILTQNLPSLPSHAKPMSVWFLTISSFSMLPLLVRDGLLLPTISLSLLYLAASRHFHILTPLPAITKSPEEASPSPLTPNPYTSALNLLMSVSLSGCAIITTLMVFIPPPTRYPFLWPLVASVYSAAHFIMFTFYYHYLQFTTIRDVKMEKKIK